MHILTDTSEPEDLTKSYKFTIHKCIHIQTCIRGAHTHARTHTHAHTGILSIHSILVLGTLVIVDHANITKPPPHALLPSCQYISVQHSHSQFQTKIAACHAQPLSHFGALQKLHTAKISKMCYECTQLGGLAEWFTRIELIEVDMPYTVPEIRPSEVGATDTRIGQKTVLTTIFVTKSSSH